MGSRDGKPDTEDARKSALRRVGAAAAIAVPVLVYLVLVLCLPLPTERRLGVVELALLVITALLVAAVVRPGLLKDIRELRLGDLTIKLERKLERQQEELDQIQLIMTLLMDERKREILKGLFRDKEYHRHTSEDLFNDMIYLRGMQLIDNVRVPAARHFREVRPGTPPNVHDINIKEIAQLTRLGQRYAKNLMDMELEAKVSVK